MGSENPQNLEVWEVALLEKINATLAGIGSIVTLKRPPKFLKEYLPLKDKVVLMVDDVRAVLEKFIPYMVVATGGKAFFLQYKEQERDELIREIMNINPDIILMDYNLSEIFKGPSAIRKLKELNFPGITVGFSSDIDTTRAFLRAGAAGFIDKGAYVPPEDPMKKLASLVAGADNPVV